MTLSQLIASRQLINRQANLANLAYAYLTVKRFADRVQRAGLRGRVRLRPADVTAEHYWASLTAVDGAQSVVEEHFSEEDVMDLADAVAYAIEGDFHEVIFPLERMHARLVVPLQVLLAHAGITIDLEEALDPDTASDAEL